MKRKAVVRLLAGTLCTATMAGSILPDTAVAYAKENPVGTVETATQEETSDTDKKTEAERRRSDCHRYGSKGRGSVKK